ncbi:macro domain-containing protein [Klebsiella pneumoniae]|nr:macro domain-containing protein [Klebsiella pneumoniae]MBL3517664.1 macro domain-containing protein [Klebsiella pneumoniae]
MAVKPEVILGDITTLDVDVIVNAANPSLLGGGGVDGAIHRAAGPALLAACKQVLQQQGECPPGHAVITIAGNLPASAVIHTVGPVWHGGDRMEAQTLADAYKNSLQLASANNYRSIAFPAISTGVYGYPKEEAAVLAGRIPTSAATKSDNYLLMEINAEASRNPRLREILMQADRRLKEEGGRLSQRYHPGLSDARRNAASELIAVLTEGAAYRCELSASTPVDKADLEALYNMIFDRLFDEQA